MKKNELLIALGLITLAVVGRLVPHLPDATPLTAVTLASVLYLGARWATVVPLVAVFVSDLIIGLYDWRVMASVYVSWLLIGLMSSATKRFAGTPVAAAVALCASLLFYFITNTAVWAFSPWYAKSLAGLLYCLDMGLPFLRNMMIGDAIYVPLLLGVLVSARYSYKHHVGAYAK